MDIIIEILLDCVLSLVVDSGVEVMTGSESCLKWPKGVKIAPEISRYPCACMLLRI